MVEPADTPESRGQLAMAWPPRTPSKRTFRRAAVTSENLDSLSECSSVPLQQDALEEQEEDSPHSDPLLCYYSRAFHRLYKQLCLVKPAMIQGCGGLSHLVLH
jgi:hypothetical protein